MKSELSLVDVVVVLDLDRSAGDHVVYGRLDDGHFGLESEQLGLVLLVELRRVRVVQVRVVRVCDDASHALSCRPCARRDT